MKFFIEKNFWFKLIVTICICLTVFNFVVPSKVRAESLVSAVGGEILDPVVDLIVALSDGIIEIIQQSIMGTGTGLYFDNEKESWWVTAGKALAAIAIVVAVIAVTGGVGALITTTVAEAISSSIVAGMVSGVITTALNGVTVFLAFSAASAIYFPKVIYLPTFSIGPEEIFSGKILLFDVNIFNPKTVDVKYTEDDAEDSMSLEDWNELKKSEEGLGNKEFEYAFYDKNGKEEVTSINNSAYELKETISKWYYIIRNIALVALMSVLIYIGIRILISSVASEKAKYKEMLKDWLVAMCLILLMQYIMVFANTFVESVVEILENITDNQNHIAVITCESKDDKILKKLKDDKMEDVIQGDGKTIYWPTNLMGRMRVLTQEQDGTSGYVGYALCYVVLVLYTLYFSFTYLKRLLYIMFLTVISPFVALTYPIDKIKDGQAQAFNMWLKEYIYNLLIQPFHLLIYVIFVCMAIDLSGSNILYSLVVIGFMIPAEKFLRAMFGFNKASTPGFLAGPAGAAMTISAMKSLAGFAGGKGKKTAGTSKEDSGKIKENNITTPDMETKGINRLLGDVGSEINDKDSRTEDENKQSALYGDDDNYRDENSEVSAEETNRNRRLSNMNKEQRSIKGSMKTLGKKGIKGIKSLSRNATFRAGAAKTLRATSKLALGGGAAGLGIAMGIASGNPENVLKYGTTGAYAGSSIGEGLANKTIDTASSTSERMKAINRDREIRKYGLDGYKKRQRQRDNEQFMQDKNIRKMYKQELGLKTKDEINEAMRAACDYREYGVTDNKLIIKSMNKVNKRNKENPNNNEKWNSKENIAAAKLSTVSKTEDDLQDRLKQYAKVPGIDKLHVKTMEKKIRELNDM